MDIKEYQRLMLAHIEDAIPMEGEDTTPLKQQAMEARRGLELAARFLEETDEAIKQDLVYQMGQQEILARTARSRWRSEAMASRKEGRAANSRLSKKTTSAENKLVAALVDEIMEERDISQRRALPIVRAILIHEHRITLSVDSIRNRHRESRRGSEFL